MSGIGVRRQILFGQAVHRECTMITKNSAVYNSLVDFFKHVRSEQSFRWFPNYKQNVNGIIRQVEDQKVEIKPLMNLMTVLSTTVAENWFQILRTIFQSRRPCRCF